MIVGKSLIAAVLVLAGSGGQAALATPAEVPMAARTIDLAQAFGTRSPWTFTTPQGPDITDPIMGEPDAKVPGELRLCISRDHGRTCSPVLDGALTVRGQPDTFSEAPYLNDARIVFPAAGTPILWLQVGSLQSINGDQRIGTVALAYDRTRDTFVAAYARRTAHNNNQEVRYIAQGPLRGAILSAEPTMDAPFGFWMTVNRIGPNTRYAEVLRYRSATRYGDGNTLAVIDSEMPNIQRRLGLWHPGSPMPRPPGPCPRPHLVAGALWCR
jgi:hypothetical protein